MNANQLAKLEKNTKLRRKISSEGIWKNYAFVPPFILIFVSIFGLIYLLNNNLLTSIYAIPFAVIFILATLWFKSVRKYIINKKIASQDVFQLCLATTLFDQGDDSVLLFFTDNHRHDNSFLEKQKHTILNNKDTKNILNEIDIQRLDVFKFELAKNNVMVTKIKKNKKKENYIIIYSNERIISCTNNSNLLKFS